MSISENANLKLLTNIDDPILTSDGKPVVTKLTFQLVNFNGSKVSTVFDGNSGELITAAPAITVTDENGEFSINLWPNNSGTVLTAYKVTASNTYIKPFYIFISTESDEKLATARASYTIGTQDYINILSNYITIAEANTLIAGAVALAVTELGGLVLGELQTNAYRGDRGKVAYDHSQLAHADLIPYKLICASGEIIQPRIVNGSIEWEVIT